MLQFYGYVNDFLDLCCIVSCDLAIDLICIVCVLVIITYNMLSEAVLC